MHLSKLSASIFWLGLGLACQPAKQPNQNEPVSPEATGPTTPTGPTGPKQPTAPVGPTGPTAPIEPRIRLLSYAEHSGSYPARFDTQLKAQVNFISTSQTAGEWVPTNARFTATFADADCATPVWLQKTGACAEAGLPALILVEAQVDSLLAFVSGSAGSSVFRPADSFSPDELFFRNELSECEAYSASSLEAAKQTNTVYRTETIATPGLLSSSYSWRSDATTGFAIPVASGPGLPESGLPVESWLLQDLEQANVACYLEGHGACSLSTQLAFSYHANSDCRDEPRWFTDPSSASRPGDIDAFFTGANEFIASAGEAIEAFEFVDGDCYSVGQLVPLTVLSPANARNVPLATRAVGEVEERYARIADFEASTGLFNKQRGNACTVVLDSSDMPRCAHTSRPYFADSACTTLVGARIEGVAVPNPSVCGQTLFRVGDVSVPANTRLYRRSGDECVRSALSTRTDTHAYATEPLDLSTLPKTR